MASDDPFDQLVARGATAERKAPEAPKAKPWQPGPAELELGIAELQRLAAGPPGPRAEWARRRLRQLGRAPSPAAKPAQPSPSELASLLASVERQLALHRQRVLAELDRFEAQVRKRLARLAGLPACGSDDD